MRVVYRGKVHEVYCFEGSYVDTECGKRIWGEEGKEYRIVFPTFAKGDHDHPIWGDNTTCPKCLSLPKSSPIKGITIYRDTSRREQPLSQIKGVTKMVKIKPIVKPERPYILGGITVKVKTGCGPMYVQLNWYRGRLFEVFATLGKVGGCAICQTESLTRSITLGLKCGVPLSEYIRQLRDVRCPNPVPFPKEEAVLSCPDAIAKTLERYGTLPVDGVVKLLRSTNGDTENIETPEDEMARAVTTAQGLAKAREEQELSG